MAFALAGAGVSDMVMAGAGVSARAGAGVTQNSRGLAGAGDWPGPGPRSFHSTNLQINITLTSL